MKPNYPTQKYRTVSLDIEKLVVAVLCNGSKAVKKKTFIMGKKNESNSSSCKKESE
jgi:hypothetical protein